jgi:hypothetical protein
MRFIFPDEQMALLEYAAILYFDKLPADHPLRREHSEQDVRGYVVSARLWHYRFGIPPYLGQQPQPSEQPAEAR